MIVSDANAKQRRTLLGKLQSSKDPNPSTPRTLGW